MTEPEIMARITVLTGHVIALQNELRDLYVQIREGLDEPVDPVVE